MPLGTSANLQLALLFTIWSKADLKIITFVNETINEIDKGCCARGSMDLMVSFVYPRSVAYV